MKLSEAIEINEEIRTGCWEGPTDDKEDALNLDIEALKAIIEWRIDYNDDGLIELPGETKE